MTDIKEQALSLWDDHGVFATHFPNYQHRSQQVEMSLAVQEAISQRKHALIEAGTGIGKTLAYLAPIIMDAFHQNHTAIISTATINLQEQLLNKDVPNVLDALEAAGLLPKAAFRYVAMKGKANYLCSHHVQKLQEKGVTPNTPMGALVQTVSRWKTTTGDRVELDLTNDMLHQWPNISAQYSASCPIYRGSSVPAKSNLCFFSRIRDKARTAHLIITNHAMLLSDLSNAGHMSHASVVVIDEGHQLEEEASRQFGWEITEYDGDRRIQELSTDKRFTLNATRLKTEWDQFWKDMVDTIPNTNHNMGSATATIDEQLRATDQWQTATATAKRLENAITHTLLHIQETTNNDGTETAIQATREFLLQTRTTIEALMSNHNENQVRWTDIDSRGRVAIRSAPLDVSPYLKALLFEPKDSVIITSATLAAERKDFSFTTSRIGFPEDGLTLALTSPFDYPKQAQFLVPRDMPNPKQGREYAQAMAQAICDVARQLNGHTMALFTSHSALRECARTARIELANSPIPILAQGMDGNASTIVKRFRENPNQLILGTQSFWQGVDFANQELQALIVCRLPFPVPTDPITNARAELTAHPFFDFHLPTAILRLRQGCGRLIRNDRSKGSVIILDQRILTARYGAKFAKSLPNYHTTRTDLQHLGQHAQQWVDQPKEVQTLP